MKGNYIQPHFEAMMHGFLTLGRVYMPCLSEELLGSRKTKIFTHSISSFIHAYTCVQVGLHMYAHARTRQIRRHEKFGRGESDY